MITKHARLYWYNRGRMDALNGKNALMRPTANGDVFFDIDPPDSFFDDYIGEQVTEVARTYHEGFCSIETNQGE